MSVNRPLVLALAILMSVPVGVLAGLPLDPARLVPTGDVHEISLLDVDATIIRDTWGVPHIYADDAYSLFFANGYAQAQDRLAQMEILRHVGKGELAALTGPSGLALDLVTRRELYTHEERQAALEALPEQWQQAFHAFADGVNHRITEATATGDLPVEYPALVTAPVPWEATDTVAIAQYLLDVFGRGGGGQEVVNAQILAQLKARLGEAQGATAFDDIVWGLQEDTYTTIKPADMAGVPYPLFPLPWEAPQDLADLGDLEPAQLEAYLAALEAEDVHDTYAPVAETLRALGWPFQFGSNAQLLDERFAANGKPLLYGGPQMGYFAPMIPYEVALHGAGFDAVGMGVAGAPGVIIGRSANLSWTVTSGSSDQVDIVVEKLVDDYTYLVDGEERAMDCRQETHLVRPGPADLAPDADPNWRPPMPDVVTQEVCRTIHGPVLGRTPDGEYAFASHRSYRGDEVRSGTLWLQIGTVQSLDQMQDLMRTFRFTFNFNAVSADGGLLYMHVGAQPARDERLDQRLPRPGWDSSYEWKALLTGGSLPHVRDPPSGYTVNWNNNPAPGWHSGDQRELWGEIHRAQLMEETLLAAIEEKGLLTLDDLREVNEYAATHEPYADDFLPLWRDAAVALGATDAVAAIDAWTASGYDYADRDDDGNVDHAAFRLYELFVERLTTQVFDDELGDFVRMPHWDPTTGGDPHAADHGEHGNKFNVLIDLIRGEAGHAWCDVHYEENQSVQPRTCAEAARRALADALAQPWSAPLPERESRFTPLGAQQAYRIPMTNRPSFQHFYDWGLPEGPQRSRNVLPPGASGHMDPLDFLQYQAWLNDGPVDPPAHVVDQLQMYVDFQDKPLLHALDAVEAHEESRTTFGSPTWPPESGGDACAWPGTCASGTTPPVVAARVQEEAGGVGIVALLAVIGALVGAGKPTRG